MSWPRWTQQSKKFPKPVYGFTEYLKRIGDYILTNPVNEAEYQKIKDAAKFWAWYHDKRVRITKNKKPNNMFEVEIRLVAHHRNGLSHRKYSS
jgi:hypothetical protein